MQCPECRHPNVPGALFCERCGADLPETAGEQGTSDLRVPTLTCAACGAANRPDSKFCEACGKPLTAALEPAPEPVPEPPAAEAAPTQAPEPEPVAPAVVTTEPEPARRLETPGAEPPPVAPPTLAPAGSSGLLATGPQLGKVKLVVEQGLVVGKQFILNAERMLVGREDTASGVFPDLDLSGLDEGYVHRRHATLNFEGSFLFVTHLGGHNRTYVNNRPIADNLPHPLDVGDTVRFGKVVMRLLEA